MELSVAEPIGGAKEVTKIGDVNPVLFMEAFGGKHRRLSSAKLILMASRRGAVRVE